MMEKYEGEFMEENTVEDLLAHPERLDGTISLMGDDLYFKFPAVDQTALKLMDTSPLAYAYYQLHHDEEPNPAFAFGKAAHSLVLGEGPEVVERPDMRTKAGKALAQEISENHPDAVLLPAADYKTVHDMAESPASNPVSEYIQGLGGCAEVAMVATDPNSGVLLKGKADWMPSEPDADGVFRIRDYKTSTHPLKRFANTAREFGYHIQAAFYMRLARLCTERADRYGFEFVVQEKKPPYDWQVFRFDETQPEIVLANHLIDKWLQQIASFQSIYPEDTWENMLKYGADKQPQTIQYPDWWLLETETKLNEGA